MDGDIGRVMVKLTATKQIVKVMQATVRLVPSSEFENFGFYLSEFCSCLNCHEYQGHVLWCLVIFSNIIVDAFLALNFVSFALLYSPSVNIYVSAFLYVKELSFTIDRHG